MAAGLLLCVASIARAEDGAYSVILDKDHTDGWRHIGAGEVIVSNGVATTKSAKGAKGGMYLYDKSSFKDFTLKLEFSVDTDTSNSGIMLRFPEPGDDYNAAADQGYEIDIYGAKTGTIVAPPEKVRPPNPVALKAGEWNECEVTVTGQRFTVKLNGQTVNEYTGNRALEGYIGLQNWEGNGDVHFRNVRIKDLSPKEAADLAAKPPMPKAPATAADLVHDHGGALVVVKGDDGSGSGFVCTNGKQTMLYTNIHVIANLANPRFTQLDGTVASIGNGEVASGRDVARFQIKNPPAKPLEMMDNFEENVRIGDKVWVLGNSGGGGVITTLTGSIAGIGPDRIEVSAEFIPGNSGSPIIHVKTGKVIGVATYLTVRRENPTKPFAISMRRFGYRVDNASAWESLDWKTFREDASSVKQVSNLTDDAIHFIEALEQRRTPDFATDALRRPAAQWMKEMHSKLSGTDRRTANESFLRALKLVLLGDVTAARGSVRYSYFREELDEARKTRESLSEGFDKVLK